MSDTSTVTVDLAKLQQEIAALDKDKLREQLLGMRVRQKVQQKKQQAKGSQKQYQLKARARYAAMKEAAIAAGIWDEINEQAEAAADAKLEGEEVPSEE